MPQEKRPCIKPDCPKMNFARGLCSTHYKAVKRAGRLEEEALPAQTVTSIFTPEVVARAVATNTAKAADNRSRYLKAVMRGLKPSAAAKSAGVVYETVRHWRKDPMFVQSEADAEAVSLEPVEDALYQKALTGDVPAVKLILERRSRSRWAPEPTVIEHKQTLELEAGPRMDNIMKMFAMIEERKALGTGDDPDIIDAEVVDTPPSS